MNKTPKISLKNVSFAYGQDNKILNEISLEIQTGNRVCFLGGNGSGKTTLLKIIAGLLDHTSGQVMLDGKPMSEAKKSEVCYVFQEAEFQIVASTVEEDVAFGAENLCLPTEEIEERVATSLDAVGLTHKRCSDVECLSGGQKSCLVLAGMLAMKPSVILLDDATCHLDSKGRERLEEVLQRLKAEGKTIISAEYSLDKIENCDRVFVLQGGAIVAEKTQEEIKAMTDSELAELGFFRKSNLLCDELQGEVPWR